MLKVRSHRRVTGLKPTDYDHEIGLINHEEAESPPTPQTSLADPRSASTTSRLVSLAETEREETEEHGTEESGAGAGGSEEPGASGTDSRQPDDEQQLERLPEELEHEASLPHPAMKPSIEIEAATPGVFNDTANRIVPRRPKETRETAIDILYENERGGFLCGAALFSSRALGALDPPAWTNAYHKSSPTTIQTAQVPDPSWEWVWPEWRVNHQEGMDEGGWEYSFAFSNKFSWHGPAWWNSFVRRRAWIRKRARKRQQDMSADPHMLNTDYFIVRPASHRSNGSVSSGHVPSRSSVAQLSTSEVAEEQPDIEDIESLLRVLRHARIDREKREAVENYLEHATDLPALQREMHEIMSLFIFQASRRQLLSYLMRKHEETVEELEQKSSKDQAALSQRKEALDAAIGHADEEVRKLAYWSDVKQMADDGELRDPSDAERGWHDAKAYQALDRSGPVEPNKGKLPEP